MIRGEHKYPLSTAVGAFTAHPTYHTEGQDEQEWDEGMCNKSLIMQISHKCKYSESGGTVKLFFFGENACVENASVNKTNGEKGPSCTVSYLFGRRPPGYGPGGEGELQVIAPLIPVNIEQLSGKEKPRYKFRFQGFWVYFR